MTVGRPTLAPATAVPGARAPGSGTDDGLANISIAMAARSWPRTCAWSSARAKGGWPTRRSLFQLGIVRDEPPHSRRVPGRAGNGVGRGRVVCRENGVQLLYDDGRLEEAAITAAT